MQYCLEHNCHYMETEHHAARCKTGASVFTRHSTSVAAFWGSKAQVTYRAAGGDGGRGLAGDHGHGEVPGGNRVHHAHRVLDDHELLVGGRRLQWDKQPMSVKLAEGGCSGTAPHVQQRQFVCEHDRCWCRRPHTHTSCRCCGSADALPTHSASGPSSATSSAREPMETITSDIMRWRCRVLNPMSRTGMMSP
jgi:hypothetical protein